MCKRLCLIIELIWSTCIVERYCSGTLRDGTEHVRDIGIGIESM